jgi:cytochrome bd-type quinol oxidase subunit 2
MFLNPAVDPVRLSTSWLIKANHLAFIRGLISLYIFTSIITILALRANDKTDPSGHYFSYFTSLTFFGLAFYFAFSAFHSWTFWRRGLPALSHWGVVLQQLQSIFYSTIVVYPYIVTSKSLSRCK